MKQYFRNTAYILIFLFLFLTGFQYFENGRIVSYTVDVKTHTLKMYWKDGKGNLLGSLQNLKTYLGHKDEKLLFAMNGGMYKADHSPQGLFIQEGKVLTPTDTTNGKGNFYLKPNGIFYITNNNIPGVCKTEDFAGVGNVKYATQSGPMLIVNGEIHPSFIKGSTNLNIRNGVGILPDNNVIFAISREGINFYDFASYFKRLGCKNALYLDGYVSRAYIPEKNWLQLDGQFGVIIGVAEKNTKK